MRFAFFIFVICAAVNASADFTFLTCKQMWTGWNGRPGPAGAIFQILKTSDTGFRLELDMLDSKGTVLSSLHQDYQECRIRLGEIPVRGMMECDPLADEAFSVWFFGDRVELNIKTAKRNELEPRLAGAPLWSQFAKWFSIESCVWR